MLHGHLRARESEGRGRQDDDRRQSRSLPRRGREPTLLVDLDPQANATSGLGERANGTSSFDLLDGAPADELASGTRFANLELIPARPDLAGAAASLALREDAEQYLAEALRPAATRYRYVFLDCPPSWAR